MGARILVFAIVLSGCKMRGCNDNPNFAPDGGMSEEDAPPEGEDAAPDAPEPDAGIDAEPDAMPDAAIDAAPDAAIDAAPDAMPDAAPDAMPDAGPVWHLFETGLCVDAACTAINAGITEFRPRWTLWTDGAAKRRWIQLPPGTTIDDSNMDYWSFPVGTKLWKEFVRDGVRVETRYMVRTGPNDGDWDMMAFAWNAAQTDAVAVPAGVVDANGTQHDIPAQALCAGCHANVRSHVLGFSALQLDYDAPAGLMDIDGAIAAGWLSNVPGTTTPHLPVPGNAMEVAALGYFHANCGHCHNSDSPLINRPMLRLEVDYLGSVQMTRAYQSSVNVAAAYMVDGATIIAKPGDPDHSVIITRIVTMNTQRRMPALGVELVDPTGLAILRDWIANIPP